MVILLIHRFSVSFSFFFHHFFVSIHSPSNLHLRARWKAKVSEIEGIQALNRANSIMDDAHSSATTPTSAAPSTAALGHTVSSSSSSSAHAAGASGENGGERHASVTNYFNPTAPLSSVSVSVDEALSPTETNNLGSIDVDEVVNIDVDAAVGSPAPRTMAVALAAVSPGASPEPAHGSLQIVEGSVSPSKVPKLLKQRVVMEMDC